MTLWESAGHTGTLTTEAVVRRCSVKKIFLIMSQNTNENTCIKVSFLNKVAGGLQLYQKKTLAQVFSCEFCEVFKNTLFHRTPPMVASASDC